MRGRRSAAAAASRRRACGSTATCGFSRRSRAAALATLGAPTVGGGVDHLALQVRERDRVVVDDAERADPGGGEVEQRRAAEAAGADDEHPRRAQPLLAGPADLVQHDMAGVALELVGGSRPPGGGAGRAEAAGAAGAGVEGRRPRPRRARDHRGDHQLGDAVAAADGERLGPRLTRITLTSPR